MYWALNGLRNVSWELPEQFILPKSCSTECKIICRDAVYTYHPHLLTGFRDHQHIPIAAVSTTSLLLVPNCQKKKSEEIFSTLKENTQYTQHFQGMLYLVYSVVSVGEFFLCLMNVPIHLHQIWLKYNNYLTARCIPKICDSWQISHSSFKK